MSECRNCKIIIIDDDRCPFCGCVLHKSENEAIKKSNSNNETEVLEVEDNSKNTEIDDYGVGGYPDAVALVRKYRFIVNIVLFVSIVLAIISVLVNYQATPDYLWSPIVLLGLLYINSVMHFAFIGQNGYRFNVLLLTLIAVGVMVGIDEFTGYHGWSVNYIVPSAVIFLDIGIVILMIVNRRNWQSYMVSQMMTMTLSFVPVVLRILGIISFPYLVQVAFFGSLLLFLGTLIIGDRRARQELARRFHV